MSDNTMKKLVDDRLACGELVTVKWLADKAQVSSDNARRYLSELTSDESNKSLARVHFVSITTRSAAPDSISDDEPDSSDDLMVEPVIISKRSNFYATEEELDGLKSKYAVKDLRSQLYAVKNGCVKDIDPIFSVDRDVNLAQKDSKNTHLLPLHCGAERMQPSTSKSGSGLVQSANSAQPAKPSLTNLKKEKSMPADPQPEAKKVAEKKSDIASMFGKAAKKNATTSKAAKKLKPAETKKTDAKNTKSSAVKEEDGSDGDDDPFRSRSASPVPEPARDLSPPPKKAPRTSNMDLFSTGSSPDCSPAKSAPSPTRRRSPRKHSNSVEPDQTEITEKKTAAKKSAKSTSSRKRPSAAASSPPPKSKKAKQIKEEREAEEEDDTGNDENMTTGDEGDEVLPASQSIKSSAPRTIMKTEHVTETYLDKDGFMVTRKVAQTVVEEKPTDAEKKALLKKQTKSPDKHTAKTPMVNTAKKAQSSILSFFKK